MLPKTHRITPPQFRRNTARYSHHENPVAQIIAKDNDLHIIRAGIVVPKRLDKRSVYRNRTKRKISEVIHKKVIGESVGVDLMIKSKKIFSPDESDTFAQLVSEVAEKAIFTHDQTKPKFT
ncbi:hypothetical protein A3D77_01370 [Candidatus Gottesmanbacteria bacterium RIFCSPHIGHO2_02_FULL_39_11]|uniref:Uncharacterized protein n=1 Tax=Candidatus Gottesmanbacteria bacterium RIFCSPHIGHO2_02_FULL_39_11 TaxID=1798382 RepID=A0A1F5ZT86_9BACT|nr:MAG: hypothetical protein A3D77_01370 [Candidatus Gottesmanbacteria bacterium RIFCSPHIGHO2_02_FULL_39_11]